MKLRTWVPKVDVSNLFKRVCRFDFSEPGFAVVDFGDDLGSHQLRGYMVAMKESLSDLYEASTGKRLGYTSMGRFNQQSTTKFHRDNAPAESYLMLGYEPTPVQSSLSMADYSKRANELGLSPDEYLLKHNPMFKGGEETLAGCISTVRDFDSRHYQLIVINNSCCPFNLGEKTPQGVLHRGEIATPDFKQRRVINSTMMVALENGEQEAISYELQEEFATTGELAPDSYKP